MTVALDGLDSRHVSRKLNQQLPFNKNKCAATIPRGTPGQGSYEASVAPSAVDTGE